MPVSYREIESKDIPDLFRVRVATWHTPYGVEELTAMGITPESVAHQLASGTHRGWVAEVEESIIGFAIGNRSNGEMWVIAVLSEFEGQGIGAKLIRLVENWLFREGWAVIWLTTDLDPAYRAVGFYKRLGWVDWKMEKDRYMRKLRPERRPGNS